jgi:hypothetical protein
MAHLFEQLNLSARNCRGAKLRQRFWLKDQKEAWRPDVATKENLAKQIAGAAGKTVIVYSGPKLYSGGQ